MRRRLVVCLLLAASAVAGVQASSAYFQSVETRAVAPSADTVARWVTVTDEGEDLHVEAAASFPEDVESLEIDAGGTRVTIAEGESRDVPRAELRIEFPDGSFLRRPLP
jgi:hypothetical protein